MLTRSFAESFLYNGVEGQDSRQARRKGPGKNSDGSSPSQLAGRHPGTTLYCFVPTCWLKVAGRWVEYMQNTCFPRTLNWGMLPKQYRQSAHFLVLELCKLLCKFSWCVQHGVKHPFTGFTLGYTTYRLYDLGQVTSPCWVSISSFVNIRMVMAPTSKSCCEDQVS